LWLGWVSSKTRWGSGGLLLCVIKNNSVEMIGRNASVCCWFRWTTVWGIDRVWNGIIASNRGELEERGLCTCVSRDPDWIWSHTHTHTYAHTYAHIMISSSLGIGTSAGHRGGNIIFLFLWKCENKDIKFCLCCYFISQPYKDLL